MAINESGGIKGGSGGDDVKVTHTDSGQSGIEQLLSQEKPAPTQENTPVNAEHPVTDLINSEGVGGASVAPVFIQPNEQGKFQFTKVELTNTIHEDLLVEEKVNLNFNPQEATVTSGHSEFAQQNFGINLQNLAGADLAFNKIYFAGGQGGASFNAQHEGLQAFGPGAVPSVAAGGILANAANAAATVAPHITPAVAQPPVTPPPPEPTPTPVLIEPVPIFAVAVLLPSLTVYCKVTLPLKPTLGVNVQVPSLLLTNVP